jgi:hypothetical protein
LLAENLLADDAINRLVARAAEDSGQARAQAAARRDSLDRQIADNAKHQEQARRRLATADDDLVPEYEATIRTLKVERANLEDALRALDREQQTAEENRANPDRVRGWLDVLRLTSPSKGVVAVA